MEYRGSRDFGPIIVGGRGIIKKSLVEHLKRIPIQISIRTEHDSDKKSIDSDVSFPDEGNETHVRTQRSYSSNESEHRTSRTEFYIPPKRPALES
ncbi:hypothetical protein Anas_13058 [Armadillidium nasatum]|uniref:Uncharacterized protein n=1 Tax=Armadillidium nasatum TaxID=96803 RepID=A0A5N5T925_9CRUS|nr:hypothetical protein Anas_13058 [Armadillidium nasatum]